MKIYEFRWHKEDEKEWVAATTLIHAIQVYCSTTGTDIIDFDIEDEIIELPEDKWSEYTVFDTEDKEIKRTFKEWMEDNSQPDIIAGTMYY